MRPFPRQRRPIGALVLSLGLLGALLAAAACSRKDSGAPPPKEQVSGPARESAQALRSYLDRRDAALLAEARAHLGAQPATRGPDYELLDGLARYLQDGPDAIPNPLFRAALRALAEEDGALARRLLDLRFLGVPGNEGMESEDAFVRVLTNCSLPSRLHQEDPAATIAFMGVAPGQAVVDVGSGPGFFTFPLVAAVGPTGRVYAVEVNERMLDFVRRHAEDEGVTNVTVVRARLDDIALPAESVDHAFMTHMFVDIELNYPPEHRQKLFGSVRRALRPGGRFTVCEPYVEGRANLTQDELTERLVDLGFQADARPAPGSPIADFNCVRVRRPAP